MLVVSRKYMNDTLFLACDKLVTTKCEQNLHNSNVKKTCQNVFQFVKKRKLKRLLLWMLEIVNSTHVDAQLQIKLFTSQLQNLFLAVILA